jgi:two-component system KDP operon response regulator KdpE
VSAPTGPPGASTGTGVSPLVVLIEDEAAMRKFVRASLTGHNYRVVEAATASEGIAQTRSYNPDIVLLDLGLPDRDGIEVTREIRAWSSVPIVVISARGQESDKVNALDAGADDYLTKPFGVAELMARMRFTPIEYKLLTELLKSAGKVITHRQLLLAVWGPAHTGDARYLRVHMSQLRRKLEPDAKRAPFIVTESGVGYRFKEE